MLLFLDIFCFLILILNIFRSYEKCFLCIYLNPIHTEGFLPKFPVYMFRLVYRGAVVLLPLLGVPGGACPPEKYKIKRKLRLKSNTWQGQRLKICLNSLLMQGEKSLSLLKRILHYTRCTMTESRLNDLALKALQPKRLSELSTEKNHWNVCASKSQKIEA